MALHTGPICWTNPNRVNGLRGWWELSRTGRSMRVPTVLDNLIQRKELPIMAAVFVDPGRSEYDDGLASEQRSFEYDTLSGQYAQFLLKEVLPRGP
jgi:enterochelin esterase-like enzyme